MKTIFLILLFTISQILTAQWIEDNSEISSLVVICYAKIGDIHFAGTNSNGIWKSTNDGVNWMQVNVDKKIDSQKITTIAVNNNFIFAGTQNYFLVSTDTGLSWSKTSLQGVSVLSTVVQNNIIFVGLSRNKGIRYSIDSGKSFIETKLNNKTVFSLTTLGNTVFAGTGANGIYKATEKNSKWEKVITTVPNITAYTFFQSENMIYAGTESNGIFFSCDSGFTWKQSAFEKNRKVHAVLKYENFLFGGFTKLGLCVFDVICNIFKIGSYNGPYGYEVRSIWIIKDTIYIGTSSKVMKRKLDISPYKQ